jgi:hypothetical protein
MKYVKSLLGIGLLMCFFFSNAQEEKQFKIQYQEVILHIS